MQIASKKNKDFSSWRYAILLFMLTSAMFSCEDFVEISVPRTDLTSKSVFTSDETAIAAISNIYSQMLTGGPATGDIRSVTFQASLCADELENVNTGSFGQELQQFYENELLPLNSLVERNWREFYQYIYKANAILEGLRSAEGVTSETVKQLQGESKFIRAFSHFYLVNLFGDVPLILTTDFRTNTELGRTPSREVYQQIITDLKDAQILLSENYAFSSGERVRPNKWVAMALLARVYLYTENYSEAAALSSMVINNSLYRLLSDLDSVFLTNSREAIWQLHRLSNTNEAATFIFGGNPTNAIIQNQFINAFEAGDNRAFDWVGRTGDGSNTLYYPFKYKVVGSTNPVKEYSVVLRLAEQYLIRAEARTKLGDIPGAQADVNAIRNRAGLPNTNANDQPTLLLAIEQERKFELFTEWGHRWLDLKRTNQDNQVLSTLKTGWELTDALYPIPEIQIQNDPNTKQNPGY